MVMKNMSKIGKMKLTSITTQTPNCKMTSLHNDFSHSVLSRNNIGEDSEMGRKASLVLKMDRPGEMELFLESLVGLLGQLRSSNSSSNISVINNNVTQNIQNQIKNNIAIFNQRYHDSNITAILNQLNGENSFSNPEALESVHQQLADTLKKNFNLNVSDDKTPAKIGSLLIRESVKSLATTVVISRPKVLHTENNSNISYKILSEAGKMLNFVSGKIENKKEYSRANQYYKPANQYYGSEIIKNKIKNNTAYAYDYTPAPNAINVFANQLDLGGVGEFLPFSSVENNVNRNLDSILDVDIHNNLTSKVSDFVTNIASVNVLEVGKEPALINDFTENNDFSYVTNVQNESLEISKINQDAQQNVYRSQENKNTIDVYNITNEQAIYQSVNVQNITNFSENVNPSIQVHNITNDSSENATIIASNIALSGKKGGLTGEYVNNSVQNSIVYAEKPQNHTIVDVVRGNIVPNANGTGTGDVSSVNNFVTSEVATSDAASVPDNSESAIYNNSKGKAVSKNDNGDFGNGTVLSETQLSKRELLFQANGDLLGTSHHLAGVEGELKLEKPKEDVLFQIGGTLTTVESADRAASDIMSSTDSINTDDNIINTTNVTNITNDTRVSMHVENVKLEEKFVGAMEQSASPYIANGDGNAVSSNNDLVIYNDIMNIHTLHTSVNKGNVEGEAEFLYYFDETRQPVGENYQTGNYLIQNIEQDYDSIFSYYYHAFEDVKVENPEMKSKLLGTPVMNVLNLGDFLTTNFSSLVLGKIGLLQNNFMHISNFKSLYSTDFIAHKQGLHKYTQMGLLGTDGSIKMLSKMYPRSKNSYGILNREYYLFPRVHNLIQTKNFNKLSFNTMLEAGQNVNSEQDANNVFVQTAGSSALLYHLSQAVDNDFISIEPTSLDALQKLRHILYMPTSAKNDSDKRSDEPGGGTEYIFNRLSLEKGDRSTATGVETGIESINNALIQLLNDSVVSKSNHDADDLLINIFASSNDINVHKFSSFTAGYLLPKTWDTLLDVLARPNNGTNQSVMTNNILTKIANLVEGKTAVDIGRKKTVLYAGEASEYPHLKEKYMDAKDTKKIKSFASLMNYFSAQNNNLYIELLRKTDVRHFSGESFDSIESVDLPSNENEPLYKIGRSGHGYTSDVRGVRGFEKLKNATYIKSFVKKNDFMKWLQVGISKFGATEALGLKSDNVTAGDVFNMLKNVDNMQFFDMKENSGNRYKEEEKTVSVDTNHRINSENSVAVYDEDIVYFNESNDSTQTFKLEDKSRKHFENVNVENDEKMFLNTFQEGEDEFVERLNFDKSQFLAFVTEFNEKKSIKIHKFLRFEHGIEGKLGVFDLINLPFLGEKKNTVHDAVTIENINEIFPQNDAIIPKTSALSGAALSFLSQDFNNYLLSKYVENSTFRTESRAGFGDEIGDFSTDVNEYLQYLSLQVFDNLLVKDEPLNSDLTMSSLYGSGRDIKYKYSNGIYAEISAFLGGKIELLVKNLKISALQFLSKNYGEQAYPPGLEKTQNASIFEGVVDNFITNKLESQNVENASKLSIYAVSGQDNQYNFNKMVSEYFASYSNDASRINLGAQPGFSRNIINTSVAFGGIIVDELYYEMQTPIGRNDKLPPLQFANDITSKMYDYYMFNLGKNNEFTQITLKNGPSYLQKGVYAQYDYSGAASFSHGGNINDLILHYYNTAGDVESLSVNSVFGNLNSHYAMDKFDQRQLYLVNDGGIWRYVNFDDLNVLRINNTIKQVFSLGKHEDINSNLSKDTMMSFGDKWIDSTFLNSAIYNTSFDLGSVFSIDNTASGNELLYNYNIDVGVGNDIAQLYNINNVFNDFNDFNTQFSKVISLQDSIVSHKEVGVNRYDASNPWFNILAYVTGSQVGKLAGTGNYITSFSLIEDIKRLGSLVSHFTEGNRSTFRLNTFKSLLNTSLIQSPMSNVFKILLKNTKVLTEILGSNHSRQFVENNVSNVENNALDFVNSLENLANYYNVNEQKNQTSKFINQLSSDYNLSLLSSLQSDLQLQSYFEGLYNIQVGLRRNGNDRLYKNQFVSLAKTDNLSKTESFEVLNQKNYDLYSENLVNLLYSYDENVQNGGNFEAVSSYYKVYVRSYDTNYDTAFDSAYNVTGDVRNSAAKTADFSSLTFMENYYDNFEFGDVENYYNEFVFDVGKNFYSNSKNDYTKSVYENTLPKSHNSLNSKGINLLDVKVLPRILQNVMSKSIIEKEDFYHNLHEETLLTHKFASQILENVQSEILHTDTKKIQVETNFRTQKVVENIASSIEETLDVVEKNSKTEVENIATEISEKLIIKHLEVEKINTKEQVEAGIAEYLPDVKGDILVNLQKEEKEISKISETLEREIEVAIEKMVKVKVAEKMSEFEAENKKNNAKKSSNQNDAHKLLNPDTRNDAVAKTVAKNIDVDAIYEKVYARIERALVNEKRRIGQ